jgi:hypothetical protein
LSNTQIKLIAGRFTGVDPEVDTAELLGQGVPVRGALPAIKDIAARKNP